MNSARLSRTEILSYGAPSFGMGIILVGVTVFLPKYYTDVLLMGAGLLGLVFLIGRIWDAVTDPIMGHLSDRTKTRWGRRRPYIFLSAAPLALFFYLIWSPPISTLSQRGQFFQLLILYLLLYTFWTMFSIPFAALGAELSVDYHERTRLFGTRNFFGLTGAIVGTIAFGWVSYQAGGDKNAYSLLAGVSGIITMILIFINFIGCRENPEFQTREPIPFFKGIRITFKNRAFVILLTVYLLTIAGSAMIAPLTLYMGEYVFRVKSPWLVPGIILAYLIGAVASVYPWVKLSQKIGKNKTWMIAIAIGAVSGFTAMVVYNEGAWVWWFIISTLAGVAAGCGTSLGPSLFADVVDSDELETGRRREGAFFGAMTFVDKAGVGLAVFVGLQGLDMIGYVPNVEQTASVIFGMKFFYCLLPAICHVVAFMVFLLYPITPEVHAQIRAELDKRATEGKPAIFMQDQS